VLTVPAGSGAAPSGINNLGEVVGTTDTSSGNIGWLWTPADGARSLHELYDFTSAGYSVPEAFDINDSGQILVHAFDNNVGEFRMLLMSPVVSQVVDAPDPVAASQSLSVRIHPNPARGLVTLSLNAPAAPAATFRIVDVSGRVVRTLSGATVRTWDGRDSTGRNVPGGVYLIRARAGDRTATEKLVLVR